MGEVCRWSSYLKAYCDALRLAFPGGHAVLMDDASHWFIGSEVLFGDNC